MPEYVFINPDLTIGEFKDVVDDKTIPAHKTRSDGGKFLRPVVDNGPPDVVDALEYYVVDYVVTDKQVTVTYEVKKRDLVDQKQAIKNEAQRRIIELTGTADLTNCMIKQFNALMRAVEITDKRAEDKSSITPEEEAEADTLRALAAAIKLIRSKSNAIELMDPIPSDFVADKYWT